MLTWKIPVVWEEMSVIEVEANTLAEAIELAKDRDGVIPLPDDGIYVHKSWGLAMENTDHIRCLYNDGQSDEEVAHADR